MPLEIEHKYLVVGDSWRASCSKSERLRDGLVAASIDRKVRVRICEDRATIAIKSKRTGNVRLEYEYNIPIDEAEDLFRLCGDFVFEKNRHYVKHEGNDWNVDEYMGLLTGVVIAEIELDEMDMEFSLPSWVGEEVTHNSNYSKLQMLCKRLDKRDTTNTGSASLNGCILCYTGLKAEVRELDVAAEIDTTC